MSARGGLLEENEIISLASTACVQESKALSSALSLMATGLGIWV